MSISRTPSSSSISARFANFPEQLAKKLSKRFMFILDPSRLHESQDIDPGAYCFVQEKKDPKSIYLAKMPHYQSLHSKLMQYAFLEETDLLSAGELAIDNDGRVIAWSFQTGYFYQKLGLDKVTTEFLDEVGLPKRNFFEYQEWVNLKESCFTNFLSTQGAYKFILKKENATDELITYLKTQRNIQETSLFGKLYDEKAQQVFLLLQEARNKAEVTAAAKQVRIEHRKQTSNSPSSLSTNDSSSPKHRVIHIAGKPSVDAEISETKPNTPAESHCAVIPPLVIPSPISSPSLFGRNNKVAPLELPRQESEGTSCCFSFKKLFKR